MDKVQRLYIPGDKWLYFKIYTGIKTADNIIAKEIFVIIKRLHKQKIIDKWFFIRYSDPQFHLRIRLLMKDQNQSGEILQLFYSSLIALNKNNMFWKIQLDTYNRELERYGEHLIEEAESVFYADSECILSLIKKISNNDNYRWMIALKLINELLSDFGLNLEEKQKLMEDISKAYKIEFGFDEFNSKQFNTKFRENKKIIESVLNNGIKENEFISLFMPIKKRSRELKPIIEQINRKSRKKNNSKELLKSYLHMMLNRLFRSKNRMHELIIYDFMFRYYTSEIAKLKYNEI